MKKAIPIKYDGIQFRSKFEAQWYVYFCITYFRPIYEPEHFAGWIPDFGFDDNPAQMLYCELKPLSLEFSPVQDIVTTYKKVFDHFSDNDGYAVFDTRGLRFDCKYFNLDDHQTRSWLIGVDGIIFCDYYFPSNTFNLCHFLPLQRREWYEAGNLLMWRNPSKIKSN